MLIDIYQTVFDMLLERKSEQSGAELKIEILIEDLTSMRMAAMMLRKLNFLIGVGRISTFLLRMTTDFLLCSGKGQISMANGWDRFH